MNDDIYKKLADLFEQNGVESAVCKIIPFDREKYPNDEYIEFDFHNPKAFLFPHLGSNRFWATKLVLPKISMMR